MALVVGHYHWTHHHTDMLTFRLAQTLRWRLWKSSVQHGRATRALSPVLIPSFQTRVNHLTFVSSSIRTDVCHHYASPMPLLCMCLAYVCASPISVSLLCLCLSCAFAMSVPPLSLRSVTTVSPPCPCSDTTLPPVPVRPLFVFSVAFPVYMFIARSSPPLMHTPLTSLFRV